MEIQIPVYRTEYSVHSRLVFKRNQAAISILKEVFAMSETDYNARIYEKMKAEQDKYRDRLLHTYELMTTICTSGIAAILYASLLKNANL